VAIAGSVAGSVIECPHVTRYELLDRIGVGGMAEIFRGKAVAAGGFEKPVAIKRILPHLSQDSRFVELLIAEAKVLSLLKHRNIVQIFDVGLGDDAQYFLVMEYVDGKDLGAVQRGVEAKRRRIPFDLCLHIGAEICEALEHAHTAKAPDGKPMALVHRDVSPSNILLSRAGEIKLTDFGIAKRAEQEQTGTGGVRGKFAYISPEQARNEHIDPRSDVFAVAVVIWELVTNQRLFSGMGDLEALRAVREAQVRRPSEADSRLTPELDALLMTALSRDPKRRPTAGQFGAQLQSMRYSLEQTVGDPATELAKIIENAEQVERQSQQFMAQRPSGGSGFDAGDHTENTVIRLRTADAFSQRDNSQGFSAARQVIDRFEEEETRLAQLSGDQLKMLRGRQTRDSSELEAPPPPRSKRPTDEPTTARAPLDVGEIAMRSGRGGVQPINPFDGDEATRLVAPTNRRTPAPERVKPRPGTVPPPLPGLPSARPGPTQPPPLAQGADEFVPGTVHNRNPGAAGPPMPGPQQPPPPLRAMPQPPMQQQPMQQQPMQQPFDPSMSQRPQQQQPFDPSMSQRPQQQQPFDPSMSQRPQQQQPYDPYAQQPMQQQPMLPMQPPIQSSPSGQGNYPMWGVQPQLPPRGASPTAPDMMDRPMLQQSQQGPYVAGFGPRPPKKAALQPWMLVVGALIMAALAFAVTRAFIAG